MSGESVHLQGGQAAHIEALVRAAGIVVDHAGVRTAVIGGLAVTCRLATAHRATGDVDIVAEDASVVAASGSAAENLAAAGVATIDATRVTVRVHVEGTKVEIIETTPLDPSDAAAIEPGRARLFVLSHRWALETATLCTIGVAGSDVTVTVPVATASALVAMKLHAIQDRHDDHKRASDAWDLYRLLDAHNAAGALGVSFGTAPGGLTELVAHGITRMFQDEATRTRRWVHAYGDPAWSQQVTEQAMNDLADELIAVLGR